jgi:protein-S-isoprenylcysteine O-methyltransferase Ste14
LRCSYHQIESSDPERAFWAVLFSVIGIFTTFGADIQKSTELKHKKGLITTGFFKHTRNPNYLGEMMIYLGFAILSKQTTSYVIITFTWTTLFVMNMLYKEASFMEKEGWEEYRKQTYILLPKVATTAAKNVVFYLMIVAVVANLYSRGGFILGV